MANEATSFAEDSMSRREAAKYLGVSYTTLSNWHSTGRYGIPVYKIGGNARYRKSDLDKWIEERKQTQSPVKS